MVKLSKMTPRIEKTLRSTRTFQFYLRNSFFIHIAFVALTITTGKVALNFQENLKEKNLELVQASVRVDMVEMPRYTLKELQNLSSGTEEAKKEEAPASVEEVVEKAKEEDAKAIEEQKEQEDAKAQEIALIEAKKNDEKEQKKKNFQEMLKKLSNKKIDSTGDAKTEKGLYGKEESKLKELVLVGNKVSKGVSVYGAGSEAQMTAFQLYIAKLPEMIRPNWRLPSFLLDKGLKCRVRVWLAPTGALKRAEIYQSSGNQDYDHRAIQAVERSAPFPKLSEEFGKRAENGDIVLGFPL